LERAHNAASDLMNKTGCDESRLIVMHLDLGSLQSIRKFVADFKSRESKLDILINNAGVMLVPEGKTEDGFETTFGVNHLGPFLLTNLLVDMLISNEKPTRVVNLSSYAHVFGTINFDDLMFTNGFSSHLAYCQSKLANVLFSRELAKRLHGSKVTTYSVHPGGVRTDLQRHVPIIHDYYVVNLIYYYVTWPFFKEPWNGAQTSICCAVDTKLENETGKYYMDCVETEPAAEALDDNVAKRLWDTSVKLVKLQPSEIHEKLRQ
jgi:NAD(P)-dependent dehydrogenase (short-subunit alcohol dehydrogenase family)